jgi:hypothetical protein
MKIAFRVLSILVSLCIAFLLSGYAVSFTFAPLATGGREGTPITVIMAFTIFPLSFLVLLAMGDLLINHYFRIRGSK